MSSQTNGSAQTQQPLATNTDFLISQLPALRTLLASLKPKVPALAAASKLGGDDVFDGSKAQERAVYVEGQAQRAADRWGVSVGASAGPDGMGRRVAMDEVKALESVVAGLDGEGERMEE